MVLYWLNSKKDAHLLRDKQGYTPLMIAAKNGHVKPFEALLYHSANHNPRLEEFQTPEPKRKKLKNWMSKQMKKVSGLVLSTTGIVSNFITVPSRKKAHYGISAHPPLWAQFPVKV